MKLLPSHRKLLPSHRKLLPSHMKLLPSHRIFHTTIHSTLIPFNRQYLTKPKQSEFKNIPNLITISRIIISPVIGICIVYSWNNLSLLLLLYAGLSDGLDGYIARKYGLKTVLGSVLDPLADKILMFCLVSSCLAAGALSGETEQIIF
jgi:CDP-alcohol phosphatidyltransferase